MPLSQLDTNSFGSLAITTSQIANGTLSVAGTNLGVSSGSFSNYKILGQIAANANALTTIYTVPSSTSTYVTCITACNQSQNTMSIDVSVTPSGVTTGANNYILKTTTLLPADTLILEPGITLPTGAVLAANVGGAFASYSASSVSFHAYGVEIL